MFAQICCGSEDAKLIHRNHCAEAARCFLHFRWNGQTSLALSSASWIPCFEGSGCTKKLWPDSVTRWSIIIPAVPSHSLFGFIRTSLFQSRSQEWPTKLPFRAHYSALSFSPHNVIEHWHEDDSAVQCSGSHWQLLINFWISSSMPNIVN